MQEYSLSRNHWRAIERACQKRLTDQLNETYKYNAEYIYIENERVSVIEYFWEEFKKRISAVDFAYLMLYISSGSNSLEASRQLQEKEISEVGVKEKTFRRKLANCQKVANKILAELGLSKLDFKKYFAPEIDNYFHSSPSNVGYPFEHFMNLPVTKHWQDKHGERRFTNTKSCLIPEYLNSCNLCHCQCTICTATNDCRRKDAFPDNDRTQILKYSRTKIEEIANNIVAKTSPEELEGLERIYSV